MVPFRGFSHEFFCSVPVDAHGRTVASRKRRFTWQVDGCVRPCGAKPKRHGRFGIDEKLPSRRFRDLGDLAVGARCEKTRAKNQRSQKKPCRDCCAFHHRASGKANNNSATRYRVYSFRHYPVGVNVSSVLEAPPKRSTLEEIAWRVIRGTKPCWQGDRLAWSRTWHDPVRVARTTVTGRTAAGAIAARQGPHVSPL